MSIMFGNYFKTACRNLLHNKVYSALSIVGLATGMAVALLIGLWVYDQSSYDRFIPNYQHAYQVRFNYNNNGEIRTQSEVCLPLAAALKNDIPEVAGAAPTMAVSNTLEVADKKLHPRGLIAGEDFLQIFQFPVLNGTAAGALKDPYSIVLTESTARALFGSSDPINKTLRIDDYEDRRVTAVLRDLPRNSTFQFDYITAFSDYASDGWVKAATTNWNHSFFKLYVGLQPNADYTEAASKSKMLVKKYAPETYKTFQHEVTLQPLKDWHLYTEYKNGVAAGGLIDYIRMFSIIGILVLLIACINFMNLATARSEKRAKEVGVRKVMGSSRGGLIRQFLIESMLITCIAFILSLGIVQLVLPAFRSLINAHISIPYSSGMFWLIMSGYVLITGFLAGSRPAFYLSSFQPVKVLKGTFQTGRSAVLPRKALVVLQFTCSIALLISTVIIYQQIQHAKARPRGYDPDRLLMTNSGSRNYAALKQEILQTGVVTSMTKSLSSVTAISSRNTIDDWQGRRPNEPLTLAMNSLADPDYFETVGMQIKQGRNFIGNPAVDSTSVILNEAAVKRMRLKDPLNQVITWSVSNAPNQLRVIGVVNDALASSPFAVAEPTMFVYQPDWAGSLTCRLSPGVNTATALAKLKIVFDKYNPDRPFEYQFVDESYNAQFKLEMLIGKLAALFSALAIFISCLGLFGLATYTAEQRKKEIGIRKGLGASVANVWVLLCKEFIVLVIVSFIVASPVAFYYLQNWLQQYDYRVPISPLVFVVAGIIAVMITMVTISFQALKAAQANPVKNLRTQ